MRGRSDLDDWIQILEHMQARDHPPSTRARSSRTNRLRQTRNVFAGILEYVEGLSWPRTQQTPRHLGRRMLERNYPGSLALIPHRAVRSISLAQTATGKGPSSFRFGGECSHALHRFGIGDPLRLQNSRGCHHLLLERVRGVRKSWSYEKGRLRCHHLARKAVQIQRDGAYPTA